MPVRRLEAQAVDDPLELNGRGCLSASIHGWTMKRNCVFGCTQNVTPPSNRLERLHGDREGQWSIRINDQWRICFRWEDRDAHDVEVTDYH